MDSHLIESSVEMITSNKTSCLLGRMPGIWPRHSQHRDVGRGDSHATPSRRRRRFIDAVPAPGMSWQPTGQVDDRPFQRIQFHKPPPPHLLPRTPSNPHHPPTQSRLSKTGPRCIFMEPVHADAAAEGSPNRIKRIYLSVGMALVIE